MLSFAVLASSREKNCGQGQLVTQLTKPPPTPSYVARAKSELMNVLRIGRYRVLQRLGSGASSDVYLSEDSMLKRKVALKVLRRRDADDRQIRCFEREVQCASVLNHPNIITVFDVGREDDLQ